MKKINTIITNLVLFSIFAAFGCAAAMAQDSSAGAFTVFAEETRPFDFADKYYNINGVQAAFIINRATGADSKSVWTKTLDERFNGVRFLETLPAYNYDGSILFFNMYGELFEEGFMPDASGRDAMEAARSFPMFVFPSADVRGQNRQANLIEARDGYFTKNPLGLSLIVEVRYTSRTESDDTNNSVLEALGKANGYSLDGTPIIKTVDEINYLTRMGLVTQKVRGLDTKGVPSYAVAKVIDISKPGVIAPDAFLATVTGEGGKPLESENFFLENFECLQQTGELCSN